MARQENEEALYEQWETYAELYDREMGESGDDFHHNLIDPALLDAIGDVSGRTIVDAGCGNGYFVASLSARGARRVIGLDWSKRLIHYARARFRGKTITFKEADLTLPWPLDNGKCDIVTANMVAQYLGDIPSFAHEARRVLKPGGTLAVSLDHPSHALFLRALRLAGVPNPKFNEDMPYLESGYVTKRSLWDKAILGYYHRPLEQYIAPICVQRLCLTGLNELGRKLEVGGVIDVVPRVVILRFVAT